MSTPELLEEYEGFTLHRRPSEEEHGLQNTTSYTVDAPRWYVAFTLADETLALENGDNILYWHRDRAERQIVNAILDNPLVKAEVNRRYVAKKKVERILTEADMFDTISPMLIRKILEEKEDE